MIGSFFWILLKRDSNTCIKIWDWIVDICFVSLWVPYLIAVREGLREIQVCFWVILAPALIFELQWEKCHCLVASCREKLVQPRVGTAPFTRNFTLKRRGCKMPKACLFGVNNASSSFNRCQEATGFVWNMYNSEVKRGNCSQTKIWKKKV